MWLLRGTEKSQSVCLSYGLLQQVVPYLMHTVQVVIIIIIIIIMIDRVCGIELHWTKLGPSWTAMLVLQNRTVNYSDKERVFDPKRFGREMPWFGLSNNDNNDSDEVRFDVEEEDRIINDLEAGGGGGGGCVVSSLRLRLPSNGINTESLEEHPLLLVPASNPSSSSNSSNSLSSSSSGSSSSAAEELLTAIITTTTGLSGGGNRTHRQQTTPIVEHNDAVTERISFRSLRVGDRSRIQQLHEQWFPVTYSNEFYDELVTNHRLATSGDNLFTCVATLRQRLLNNQHHEHRKHQQQQKWFHEHQQHQQQQKWSYCQPTASSQSQSQQQSPPPTQLPSLPIPKPAATEENDEVIGCVVGAFLHHSRLSIETANMLVPNPQVHSKLFYIMTLGTVQEYRNYGIATMLVEQTMELVQRDPACGALYLHVIPFNLAAIRFYEKLGFYRVCTIENYYSIDDKQYDCFLYAKYFHGKLHNGDVNDGWSFLFGKSPPCTINEQGVRPVLSHVFMLAMSLFLIQWQAIVAIEHYSNLFPAPSLPFGNSCGPLFPYSRPPLVAVKNETANKHARR